MNLNSMRKCYLLSGWDDKDDSSKLFRTFSIQSSFISRHSVETPLSQYFSLHVYKVQFTQLNFNTHALCVICTNKNRYPYHHLDIISLPNQNMAQLKSLCSAFSIDFLFKPHFLSSYGYHLCPSDLPYTLLTLQIGTREKKHNKRMDMFHPINLARRCLFQ